MEWMAIIGVSTFYFQKGFAMLCGFSVAKYCNKDGLYSWNMK